MPNTRKLLQVFLYLTIVVAGIVLGPLLVNTLESALAPTPALAVATGQDAPAGGEEVQATHECHIRNVGVLNNRVHARCWTGAGAIVYFAAPTSMPCAPTASSACC